MECPCTKKVTNNLKRLTSDWNRDWDRIIQLVKMIEFKFFCMEIEISDVQSVNCNCLGSDDFD